MRRGGRYIPKRQCIPFFSPYQPPTGLPGARPQASTVPSLAGFLSSAEELSTSLTGEQPSLFVLGQPEQILDGTVGRVVQVGRTGYRILEIGERRQEITQVPAVPPNLLAGVQSGAAVRRHQAEVDRVLEQGGLAPLLELDDHVRRLPGARMDPAQHRIGSLAGQWQLVLQKDLDAVETGLHEVSRQRVQAALPGADLAGPRPV